MRRRAQPPARAGRREAGFTVLELVVATLVLLVALMLAAKLLQDIGMQVGWSGRKALEVSPNLALEQIRTDLRASQGGAGSLGTWQTAPLAVQGSSTGYAIVYEIVNGELVRRATSPSGRKSERVVLDKVVDLRHRVFNNAVEIEIEFLRMQPPLRRDTAAGMREAVTPEHRKMSILVGPRRQGAERF